MKRKPPSIQALKDAYRQALLAKQPRLYEAIFLSRAILLTELGLPPDPTRSTPKCIRRLS